MASLTQWPIGACGCNCVGGFTITCTGCGSLPLIGESIQLMTACTGGTASSTLTTNSSGQITLMAGTYYLLPANPRFACKTVTITTNQTVNFSAASGYTCFNACSDPLKNTLHASDSLGNNLTLTYQSSPSEWKGNLASGSSYAGCCPLQVGVGSYQGYASGGESNPTNAKGNLTGSGPYSRPVTLSGPNTNGLYLCATAQKLDGSNSTLTLTVTGSSETSLPYGSTSYCGGVYP